MPVRDMNNVKMTDTHVSPYKTAQRAGTLVRNVQKYEHIKDTQLHHALSNEVLVIVLT